MSQAEKIFRQHDEAPTVTSSALYRQLTLEWVHLHTRPATSTTVKQWASAEPALAGFTRPGDVVDTIDAADDASKSAILLALLRLVAADDQLAGRTLVQAMLPGLATLAARTAAKHPTGDPDSPESIRQMVLEEFWEVVDAYPIERRPDRVAANLILDTLKRVTKHLNQPVAAPFDPTPLYADVAPTGDFEVYREARRQDGRDAGLAMVDGIGADADLLTVIAWGVQEHAITSEDGQMLATVYLAEKTRGWGFDEACARLGTSRSAVKMRCSRAVARLTEAWRAEITMAWTPATEKSA